MRTRLAGVVATVVLAAGLLAGCTSARSSLGTSDSSCYLALPTATTAVNGHGRMLGVHRFTLTQLKKKAPHLYRDLDAEEPTTKSVCVVAFTGTFSRSGVVKPLGRSTGKLAVVVADAPSNVLVGTVIFARLPLRFAHSHF